MASAGGAPRAASTTAGGHEASELVVSRLRHPWRNGIAVLLVLVVVAVVIDAAQRPAYGWEYVGRYLFDQRISAAALVTLQLTVFSMAAGIALGLVLAVMRQSPNAVVAAVAWLYLWVLRGTPVYVQLVFWGLLTLIYPTVFLGVPWTDLGTRIDMSFMQNALVIAVVGLALNEAAYMAEIVRAGMLSVDGGQEEAATALGMSWALTMRRVVLPQAMRVIVPPTGNEIVSMLKTTSLVAAIPLTTDLYGVARQVSAVTYTPIPLLIVASLWYLAFTSVLMVVQHFVERRFSRALGHHRSARPSGASEAGTTSPTSGPTRGQSGVR